MPHFHSISITRIIHNSREGERRMDEWKRGQGRRHMHLPFAWRTTKKHTDTENKSLYTYSDFFLEIAMRKIINTALYTAINTAQVQCYRLSPTSPPKLLFFAVIFQSPYICTGGNVRRLWNMNYGWGSVFSWCCLRLAALFCWYVAVCVQRNGTNLVGRKKSVEKKELVAMFESTKYQQNKRAMWELTFTVYFRV